MNGGWDRAKLAQTHPPFICWVRTRRSGFVPNSLELSIYLSASAVTATQIPLELGGDGVAAR